MNDEPINIDAADGDWIKRGDWDLWLNREQLVASVEDLREWLYFQQMTVDEFKQLTVYQAHLDDMPWLRDL